MSSNSFCCQRFDNFLPSSSETVAALSMSGNYSFHAVVTSPPRLTARGGDGRARWPWELPPPLFAPDASSQRRRWIRVRSSPGNRLESRKLPFLAPSSSRAKERGDREGGRRRRKKQWKDKRRRRQYQKETFLLPPVQKTGTFFPTFSLPPSREKGRGNKAPPSLKATPSPSSSSLVRSEVEGREEEVGRFFSSVPLRQCPPGVGCGGGSGGGGVRKICSWHFCTFRGASPLFPAPRISLLRSHSLRIVLAWACVSRGNCFTMVVPAKETGEQLLCDKNRFDHYSSEKVGLVRCPRKLEFFRVLLLEKEEVFFISKGGLCFNICCTHS